MLDRLACDPGDFVGDVMDDPLVRGFGTASERRSSLTAHGACAHVVDGGSIGDGAAIGIRSAREAGRLYCWQFSRIRGRCSRPNRGRTRRHARRRPRSGRTGGRPRRRPRRGSRSPNGERSTRKWCLFGALNLISRDLRELLEDGLAHRVQGLLQRVAVHLGEPLEQQGADLLRRTCRSRHRWCRNATGRPARWPGCGRWSPGGSCTRPSGSPRTPSRWSSRPPGPSARRPPRPCGRRRGPRP